MIYKGYFIKDLTATPESAYQNEATIARGSKFAYCRGDIIDEGTREARTLDEAAQDIDELTANDPSPDDKLKIAVQCIEACKEEFQYRDNKEFEKNSDGRPAHAIVNGDSVALHMIDLCANALKAIQE